MPWEVSTSIFSFLSSNENFPRTYSAYFSVYLRELFYIFQNEDQRVLFSPEGGAIFSFPETEGTIIILYYIFEGTNLFSSVRSGRWLRNAQI